LVALEFEDALKRTRDRFVIDGPSGEKKTTDERITARLPAVEHREYSGFEKRGQDEGRSLTWGDRIVQE
jgi:hypothetical protein